MGLLAYKKTLMRCIEELEEKVMVDQHYRSSERGKAGMFWLQQELQQCDTNLSNMGSLIDRKTLMRCIEQLEEKILVDQHYRSSERGMAGRFWLQQVLLYFFFSAWLRGSVWIRAGLEYFIKR